MAHYFLSTSTQPEIFEDEDEDEYGLQDVPDCSGGDPGNNELAQAFYKFYAAKDLFTVDQR